MFGRGHKRNRHGGHQGGCLRSFFEGRPSPSDRSRRGFPVANPPGAPSSSGEVHSDDEIFREIEDYAREEERVQASDSPLYVCTSDVWWSGGASSFGGAKPSTSRAPAASPNSRYICENWVFGLSNKKLGFISHEFRLGNSAY